MTRLPANRIKYARWLFKDNEYQFPSNFGEHHLHGELCRRSWKVEGIGMADTEGAYLTTVFCIAEHKDMYTYFPYALEFKVIFRLFNSQLRLEGSILNKEAGEAPFLLGLHPYFNWPDACEQGQNVMLRVPALEEWPIGDDGFIAGLPQTTSLTKRLND